MERKNILLTAVALLGVLVINTGCTNVRTVGNINGLDVHRVTTRGVFSPSTTSIVVSDPNSPGTINGTIANAAGQGFVPAVANAAGVAGAAALLRPDRTSVNNTSGDVNATATSRSKAAAKSASKSSAKNSNRTNVRTNIRNNGGRQNGSIHHNGPQVKPPGNPHKPSHK